MAAPDPTPETTPPAPAETLQRWSQLLGESQKLMMAFMTREGQKAPANPYPAGLFEGWAEFAGALAKNPAKLVELQTKYWTDAAKLWQAFATGQPAESPAAAIKDKRFAAEDWSKLPVFDFLRQSYLLTSNYILSGTAGLAADTELDAEAKAKLLFHTRQFVDALSPSNYLLTNPQVLKATTESGGTNLLKGLEHMLDDIKAGRMKLTDEDAFEVGRNVAITPGKVVFQNRLFQLIQYSPTTEQVFEIPLLIFPPWINKYYILDLTAEKSFIRWAVAQGLTVFVVSWKNADASLADATLDTYVGEGQMTAISKVLDITGAPATHTIGYCVAGTTLAATLAYLKATGADATVRTATFFTAQVDFEHAGDLKVFVDAENLEKIEAAAAETGYTDGRTMATTFNLLRSNDLIWNYVVNNYLLGKDYFPFDLLYWNSDATNVPAKWHLTYLKDLYRDNLLAKPGGISVAGVPIDIDTVTTPSYIQAGKEDHIAPAKSVYEITRHFSGPMRFVLAGSGHIAGVVNPPAAMKYNHWTSDKLPATLDAFVAGATEHKGSWWPDWLAWLAPQSGKMVPAREPAGAIEDAPGRYVKERI
ncbi:MAG TPA: class I poly(R)-hydroxyalkanoic acid synthase [Polymorphobacter sp.]|nr:class I poly(R)-hydroxyalkanoic acid synthase [Polymorphobacter sp.]